MVGSTECRKRQIQRFIASGGLITEESGVSYALFVVTKDLQQPKSPIATTVATQKVFLNSQCCEKCCVWGFASDSLRTFLRWQHVTPPALATGSWISKLYHRRIEENCTVRWITFSCLSHRLAHRENTATPKGNPGFQVHSKSVRLVRDGVRPSVVILSWGLFLTEHIKTHNPNPT